MSLSVVKGSLFELLDDLYLQVFDGFVQFVQFQVGVLPVADEGLPALGLFGLEGGFVESALLEFVLEAFDGLVLFQQQSFDLAPAVLFLLLHLHLQCVVELPQFAYLLVVGCGHLLLLVALPFQGQSAFLELVLQLLIFLFERVDSAGVELEVEIAVDLAAVGAHHVLLQELQYPIAFGQKLSWLVAFGEHVEKVFEEEDEAFLIVE